PQRCRRRIPPRRRPSRHPYLRRSVRARPSRPTSASSRACAADRDSLPVRLLLALLAPTRGPAASDAPGGKRERAEPLNRNRAAARPLLVTVVEHPSTDAAPPGATAPRHAGLILVGLLLAAAAVVAALAIALYSPSDSTPAPKAQVPSLVPK